MMNWSLDLGDRETTGKTGPMMPMAAEKRVEPAAQTEGALGQPMTQGVEWHMGPTKLSPDTRIPMHRFENGVSPRAEAKAYLEPILQEGVKNKDTGFTLVATKSDLGKWFSHPRRDWALRIVFKDLPEIISNALLLESHTDLEHRNPAVKGIHKLVNAVRIGEQNLRVILTVRDYSPEVGERTSLHSIDNIDFQLEGKSNPATAIPEVAGSSSQSIETRALASGEPSDRQYLADTPTLAQVLGGECPYVRADGRACFDEVDPSAKEKGGGYYESDSALYQESFGENEKTYQETIEDFIGDDPSRKEAVDKLLDLMSTERQKDVVAESKGKVQIKYQKTINSKVLEAAKEAGVDLSDRESPITRALLVQTIVNDAVYATRVNSSAIGWYDEKVRKCLGYAGAMFPELDPANKGYDPNEAFRFLYVLATTSNGLKVKDNLPLAVRIYKEYKRTGTLPAWGQGTQTEPMIKTTADFEKTKNTCDNIDQMRKFFMPTWSMKQLLTMGYNVAGESATESTRDAAIIGPKIGNGFFANLNGLFEALTMDRWFMRTFGRWTGTLIAFKPENFVQKVDAFRDVIADVQKNKELCVWLKKNGNFDVDEALRDTQPSAEMAITEMVIESGASPLIRMVKRASQTFMPASFRKEYTKIWGGKDKPKSIGWRFYSAMKALERAAASDKVAPAGSTER